MSSNESVKGLFRPQTLKECKLAQLDKMLCKSSMAICSEGPGTGPMTTERAKSCYDYIEMTDKCTLSAGSNKIMCRYYLMTLNIR
jgi:hypothetical protein